MMKIALIGCGGINSWAAKHLRELIDTFDKNTLIYVKCFDEDVVEEKNILRQNQNFFVEDLMLNKAEVLAKRYKYDFNPVFITEENLTLLDNFDHLIVGVDSHKVRRMLYKYALDKGKYLLDLRAQGTQIGYFVLDLRRKMDYYDKKYFNDPIVMERRGSCQLNSDIEKDNIQAGNRIIAYFAIWGIYLKKLRGDEPLAFEWQVAY
jgi:molybdopterin/thiamine biosynthesis adenylyltransferase